MKSLLNHNDMLKTREDDERDLTILSDLYRGLTQREAAKKHGVSLGQVHRLWRARQEVDHEPV